MSRRARDGRPRRGGKDAKLKLLSDVPLFSACSRRELKKLASLVDEVDVPEGKVLMRQGKLGGECFVIVDGTARASMRGRRTVRLGPGSVLGEMSLIDGGPRSATVTADSPMHLLVMAPREFSRLIEEFPQVSRRIMKVLAVRLRDAERPQPHH